jgi:hypothetical protein
MQIRNNVTFGIAGVSKETNFHSLYLFPRSDTSSLTRAIPFATFRELDKNLSPYRCYRRIECSNAFAYCYRFVCSTQESGNADQIPEHPQLSSLVPD